MLKGLLSLISALPALLKLWDEIQKAMELGAHEITVTVDLKKMDLALVKAETTKDTSDLEGLLNPKSTP